MNASLRTIAFVASFLSVAALAGCSSTSKGEDVASSDQHVEQSAQPAEEGDVCDASLGDKACEEGFACAAAQKGSSFTGTFCQKKPVEEGDVCDDASPCAEGLVCAPAQKGSSFTGTFCQVAPAEEGDVCDATLAQPCQDGLTCAAAQPGSSFTGTFCQK